MQEQTKTVLVIEDEPDLRELMADILEGSGYRAITAGNGRGGLDAVAEAMPNVILLDMRMPVMNGWEFARLFRARYDHLTPIVVITAAADAQSRAEDIEAEGWVGKPFAIPVLLSEIQRQTRGSSAP